MSKEFEEIVLKKLEKLDLLDERTQNTDKVIEELILKKLDTLENQISNTNKELIETKETVKNLIDKFTVFDFEINKKIDALFDAITVNNEKHDLFENSIVSLNTKTFNHDIRISVLEDYNKNAKIFATN